MHAIIVGAGIGGMATAVGLGARGHEVTLLEQAEALRFYGFGLLLQPNALHALEILGLAEGVRAIGRPMLRTAMAFADGRPGPGLDFDPELAPVAVERARLLGVLHERLGRGVTLRTGARAEAVDALADGARVTLAGGEELGCDVLIGADGLHSVVRAALRGPESPRYAGYTVWRGLARGPGLAVDALREHWGRGKRFGLVPLEDELVYWFAAANAPAGQVDEPDTATALRRVFAGWPRPVLDAIERTAPGEVARLDCTDRPPIRDWGRGRVTLLGDAAHPMTPNLGQGACQALEDAAALSLCLAAPEAEAAPESALRAYERFRAPRARSFVARSWRFGKLGQRENRVVCALRDFALAHTPRGAMARAMKRSWAVSFDALS
ncbi:MAG: FAD-dependent monooxygenase [Deltaproteobacteria bacterium]|nr:FAD-dependent monooxygenase [Deltaproteobacteria bacterium]